MKEPLHFPHDGPLRWMIPSATDSQVSYLVDLSAYDGLGECQCPNWFYKCKGPLSRGEPSCCRHVIEANRRFNTWAKWAFAMHDQNIPDQFQT